MKVITVHNAKGGVAKTTTSIHFAAGLKLADPTLRVLLIDADPQGSLKTYYKLKLDRGTTIDFIFNHSLQDCVHQIPLNLSDRSDTLYFDVIASSTKLGDFETKAAQIPGKEVLLKTRFEELRLRDFYDVVIIDCPPALGLVTTNAICASDFILMPSAMDGFSSAAINFMISTLDPIRKYLKLNPILLGVLPTMFDARTIANKDTLEALKKTFSSLHFFEPIRNNAQFKKCGLNKKTVFEYETGTLNGTMDYARFVKDAVIRMGGINEIKGIRSNVQVEKQL